MFFKNILAIVKPPSSSELEQRLKSFPASNLPLRGRVQIYWSKEAVPFINAEHDLDLSFVLGLVHAHLRLGQMEIMRRVSQGRISEMTGPFTLDLDRTIRMLDLARAADRSILGMSAETKEFLNSFLAGINFYIFESENLPAEYTLLNLRREEWTMRDVFSLSRLAGADINWLVYAQLLPLISDRSFPRFWSKLMAIREAGFSSFEHPSDISILSSLSRSGSNSFVVSGKRRSSGGALIASDPHVGFDIPNNWLLAGMCSPSFHMVGIMLPGLPTVMLGRNENIGWGATNMRALTSCLYRLDKQDLAGAHTRSEIIRIRFMPAQEFKVRETDYGPVFTDAPFYKKRFRPGELALKWVGHEPSDELGALLKVNRARNWDDFRNAFKEYAVSGQNYLYADVQGNIGQVMAVRLPKYEASFSDTPLLDKKARWQGFKNSTELPHSYNPGNGYLVTANNSPVSEKRNNNAVPFRTALFYSADDRATRIEQLIRAKPQMKTEDAMQTQVDVTVTSAVALIGRIKELVGLDFKEELDEQSRCVFAELERFDGKYSVDSKGALAFQLFSFHFAKDFLTARYGANIATNLLKSDMLNDFLLSELEHLDVEPTLEASITKALHKSYKNLKKFGSWGNFHKLKLEHALARLPFVGKRYKYGSFGVPGTSNSVWKTWNDVSSGPHLAHYGTSARHISDLDDPDANYFVLLGGQDGWLNSAQSLDQVPRWLNGEYVRIPMRVETVRKEFKVCIELRPPGK